jgi:hypothetical protein
VRRAAKDARSKLARGVSQVSRASCMTARLCFDKVDIVVA